MRIRKKKITKRKKTPTKTQNATQFVLTFLIRKDTKMR